MTLHLTILPLKAFGLEPVWRFEPSSYEPISHLAIGARQKSTYHSNTIIIIIIIIYIYIYIYIYIIYNIYIYIYIYIPIVVRYLIEGSKNGTTEVRSCDAST